MEPLGPWDQDLLTPGEATCRAADGKAGHLFSPDFSGCRSPGAAHLPGDVVLGTVSVSCFIWAHARPAPPIPRHYHLSVVPGSQYSRCKSIGSVCECQGACSLHPSRYLACGPEVPPAGHARESVCCHRTGHRPTAARSPILEPQPARCLHGLEQEQRWLPRARSGGHPDSGS